MSQQRELRHGLLPLGPVPAHALPVYACTGNHDYFTPACAYNSVAWPDNFHLFHTPRIEGIPFRDGVTVWGAGFQTNAVEAPMLEGFHCEGGMNIMTLHGDCYTLTTRSNPIPPRLIEESGLTYLALGHVHTRRPAANWGARLTLTPAAFSAAALTSRTSAACSS